jgi:hypothetical protein
LILLNGSFILEQAARLADRARDLSAAINTAAVPGIDAFAATRGPHDLQPAWVIAAWRLAYARDPTPQELAALATFVASQVPTLEADPTKRLEARPPREQALINLCQVLLSSNEFLSIE